jgi:hypothetical protein
MRDGDTADRRLHRVQRQFGPQMIGHRPADDLTASRIQHHGGIEKPSRLLCLPEMTEAYLVQKEVHCPLKARAASASTFIAALERAKEGVVQMSQNQMFGAIHLETWAVLEHCQNESP